MPSKDHWYNWKELKYVMPVNFKSAPNQGIYHIASFPDKEGTLIVLLVQIREFFVNIQLC